MSFGHYPRILARSFSLSVCGRNSIVMKLYLQLSLCIALSLLGTALSGPLAMEYNDNDEPEKFSIQSRNPVEYNDEPERFTIQSRNPLESNDKPTIQSSNPMVQEYSDELDRLTIESSILDSGRPITFKCLGHIYNPNHLYLNGLTVHGGVNLAPSTHGPYTGTRWLPIRLADGSYAFKCLGHIYNRNHLYLDGLTRTGGVSLAPSTHGPYTGTHWRAYMLPDGSYSFKCLGHIYNPSNLYLDGLTGSGGVSLAPSVSGGFTGTHWRIEYA